MNHQTIATAQKAIHYYQSEVGAQRVTGGSLPDQVGLVVAVRSLGERERAPQQVEHFHNGNGSAPTQNYSQDERQAPLQALLLIADEGVDAFPLIADFGDGATIGPAGDSVGTGTKKAVISWDPNYTDPDGSLTESYVVSFAARLLPEHSYSEGPDVDAGAGPAVDKQDYTVTTEESDTPETDGITPPTDQEVGEDAEEDPEYESASPDIPSDDEAAAGEQISFPAHTAPDTGAEEDTAELEAVPQSETDTAELETVPPPEDDGEHLLTEKDSGTASDSQAYSAPAARENMPNHDPPHEQETEAAADYEDNAQTMPGAQEVDDYGEQYPVASEQPASAEDEENVSRSTLDHSATAQEPQFPPEADADDYTSWTSSAAVEASDDDVRASTDTADAANFSLTSAPREDSEPRTTPKASEMAEALEQDAGDDGGATQEDARPSQGDQKQPSIERFRYEEEREDNADHPDQEPDTSHSRQTTTHDGSEQAEESDSHWEHTLTQGRTSTPEQRAYLIQARNASKLATKLRIKRLPEQPPRLAEIDTLPEPAIERVATSPEGPGIVMPMIRKGGTGKTTFAVELAFMLARLFGDDGSDTPSRTGRVLLADMNLTNPDLPERLHVSGNGSAGVKDLLAGEHVSRVVNRTALANLDALFLLGRGDEDISPLMRDLSDEETMQALIKTMVRDGGYDVIVVDTANTLPAEAENPASFVMTMWASIADARYLILQPEKAAFKNAASFVRRLGSALGPDKPVVPVLNSFPTRKVYEEAPITPDMANRRQAAISAVEYFQDSDAYTVVPALNARGKKLANPLIVPDYPEEVRGFASEGRPLSMYSQTFANAYRHIALDAVRRMLDNRNPQERG